MRRWLLGGVGVVVLVIVGLWLWGAMSGPELADPEAPAAVE